MDETVAASDSDSDTDRPRKRLKAEKHGLEHVSVKLLTEH